MWVQVARMSRMWRGLDDTRSQVHNEVLREDTCGYGALAGKGGKRLKKVDVKVRIFFPGNF